MTYAARLNLSKILLSLAILLVLLPAAKMGAADRVDIFWLISLPVFFYLLWGKLHGTGRSVRIVGYLGLAYAASYFATSGTEVFSFISASLRKNSLWILCFGKKSLCSFFQVS